MTETSGNDDRDVDKILGRWADDVRATPPRRIAAIVRSVYINMSEGRDAFSSWIFGGTAAFGAALCSDLTSAASYMGADLHRVLRWFLVSFVFAVIEKSLYFRLKGMRETLSIIIPQVMTVLDAHEKDRANVEYQAAKTGRTVHAPLPEMRDLVQEVRRQLPLYLKHRFRMPRRDVQADVLLVIAPHSFIAFWQTVALVAQITAALIGVAIIVW